MRGTNATGGGARLTRAVVVEMWWVLSGALATHLATDPSRLNSNAALGASGPLLKSCGGEKTQ